MLFSISFNQSHQSSLSHNNRENIYGNPGIDPSRLDENIYFVQKDIQSVYKDVFQEAVDKYNEKQKRNDRKIKDYYEKIRKDEKTHEQRELVVAIGEGKDDPKYRESKKEALKQYAGAFQERNPNLAVYNMVLHDDEANPHLHINYVPNFESSRGLTRRVGMDRALQQQGVKGKGTELIANWRQSETAYIESLAKEQIPEFERANVGSHKYMKVRQYKEYAEMKSTVENQIYEKEMQLEVFDHHMKHAEEKVNELQMVKTHVADKYKELEAVEQQVKNESEKLQLIGQRYIELEKKVKQQQMELDSATDQVPNEPVKVPFLRREVITEVQDKMFGKAEIKKKQTRNYVLSPEQYQEFTKQVNAAVIIKKDYERLRETDFVKENESLKVHAEGWMEENRTLKREKSQLQKEVGVLNREISSLRAYIKGLQMNIRVLYVQTKKVLKEQFKAFRGIVKNELDSKGIDNHFEREHKREMNRHSGLDIDR
ncbi:plasmid recombination protein [Bacillus pseudomycoides]|uniref:plasmid recombination protein n=1 Tax=Bacillus pseudomycoides TaxID=64104 RepID=UPI000BED5389|nr:plasmid recombination protein [Bacillus pseudomycoides]MED4654679.1 plasmid recombination protein [Bacillus pseudomycoides]PEE02925.1 mobilization protein [Bacillus pseudomycoides]PEM35532.1 mobilization protein [Bacillus pseudomycoides]PEM65880.1 mobilization protein [Bacillus pseudomycoides]PHC86127.1 mobilization protein [Bacillus pseudomycoides]